MTGSPTTQDDSVIIDEDSEINFFDVLANDSDPENDPLTVLSFNTTGIVGTFTDHHDGTFSYDPGDAFNYLNAGETVTITFSYTISDGSSLEFDLSSLQTQNGGDGSKGFIISGTQDGGRFGSAVSSVGDVNGDGIDDFAVGAAFFDQSSGQGVLVDSGAVYVVFGTTTGFDPNFDLTTLDGTNGFSIAGVGEGDRLGYSVASAGDFNNDGYDDILISAYLAENYGGFSNNVGPGEVYVLYGKGAGQSFDAQIDLSTYFDGVNSASDRENATVFFGKQDSHTGNSVALAGDWNNDGIDDIIIGNEKLSDVYVVFGSQSYGSSTSSTNIFELEDLDRDEVILVQSGSNSNAINDDIGFSVSGSGDFNGDGIADILIGAPGEDTNNDTNTANLNNTGHVYVIYGKSAGFGTGSHNVLNKPASGGFTEYLYAVNGNGQSTGYLNGSNGYTLTGISSNNSVGRTVASAGDFNGDGIDDIILASGVSSGNVGGDAYLVFGSSSQSSPIFSLSGLDGSNGFRFFLEDENGSKINLARSVSSAGDINGDGIGDVLLGAGDNKVYVVFGSTEPFSADLDLGNLDGQRGFIITGPNGDGIGDVKVSSAGDINSDGYDDILIGAQTNLVGSDVVGESYIIFGRSSFIENVGTVTITITGSCEQIYGTSGDDSLSSGVCGDSLYGLSGDDTLVGHEGNDFVDGGAGDDLIDLGQGDDRVFANAGNDTVEGGDGKDTIYGNSGDDLLVGNSGDDSLEGQAGTDFLEGGVGNDQLYGNDANEPDYTRDYFIFNGVTDTDNIYLFEVDRDVIALIDYGVTLNEFAEVQITYLVDDNVEDGSRDMARIDLPNGVIFVRGLGQGIVLTEDNFTFYSLGDDDIDGTSDADTLFGGAGNDDIDGKGGDDFLNLGIGNDRAFGNAGNDSVLGGSGMDTLYGNSGDDTLVGGGDNDLIEGQNGADLIEGGFGDDSLKGGHGADKFLFHGLSGQDIIQDFDIIEDIILLYDFGPSINVVGDAVDAVTYNTDYLTDPSVPLPTIAYLDFGNGNKITINLTSPGILTVENFNVASSADDTLIGTSQDEPLYGGPGNDQISGVGGNDTLNLGVGHDQAFAGSGDDSVHGEEGDDSLFGSAGYDTLDGGIGDDLIKGDDGFDRIIGGKGNDSLYGGSEPNETLQGGDVFVVEENSGKDIIFDFELGSDKIEFVSIGQDFDELSEILLAADDSSGEVVIDLGGGNTLTLKNIDDKTLLETSDFFELSYDGVDDLIGDTGELFYDLGKGDDRRIASVQADTIFGGAGDDSIFGGSGDDILKGDSGDDLLEGQAGDDTLEGGAGNDLFIFKGNNGATGIDVISDFVAGAGSEDVIKLKSFTGVFESFSDVMLAASNVNGNTEISLDGFNKIIIMGITVNQLHEDDFSF